MSEISRPLVLVTGGAGFLGQGLISRLTADGWRVRATAREAGPGADVVATGELSSETDWSAALQDVDCVVHAAGRAHKSEKDDAQSLAAFRRVNVEASLALARQAAAAGVRRLVFISSIGVNGTVTHGRAFRHDDVPQPQASYALSKWEAEQALFAIAAETGLDVSVIRPPLIMGPSPKGNLATLSAALSRGWPLPVGLITKNRRDLISRDNLCDLIALCLEHPEAAGRTFLASDGAPMSTRALIERLAEDLGVRPWLLPVPPVLLRGLLKTAGLSRMAAQLTEDLEIDIAFTRDTLGWSPVAPLRGPRP